MPKDENSIFAPGSSAPSEVDRAGASGSPAPFTPEELAKRLSQFPAFRSLQGGPPKIQVRALRVHPAGPSTFEIVFYRDGGFQSLIGKVYASDRRDVYEVMEGLWQAGLGTGAEFSIPQPIAYVPSCRLLLQENVKGTLAKKTFKSGDERQRCAAAERCARWLARFQRAAPQTGRVSGVDKFLRAAGRMCRLIPQESGRLAAKAGELLELLGAVASSLGAIPACGSHGDYAHDQVILARGRTVVCDWDTYVVADPARDVAKFIVHLERLAARHLGSLCALDGTADVFLKSYLAAGGLSQVTARLPFYKAVFRLVKELEVIDTKAPGWRERAQAALDDGFRALKQDGRIVPTLSGSRPRVPFPEGCRMKEPRCS